MQIKVQTNAKQVERALRKKGKNVEKSLKRALSRTAQEGINIIERRTASSKSYKGGRFRPYSSEYKAFRQEKGRGISPDLQFSGRMLGSMTSKATNKKANIFFTRAEEAKKAAKNEKGRPFFGFSKTEEKVLGQVFFRNIK